MNDELEALINRINKLWEDSFWDAMGCGYSEAKAFEYAQKKTEKLYGEYKKLCK